MVFGKLFGGKAKDAINQFSGNKDFLEALCAACALTAAAEGGIDDAEYDQTLSVIRANSAIAAAFKATEIETCFGKMAPKTASRSGKAELMREITEAIERDKSGAMGQAIVLAALDVADQGGISEEETAVLRRIADVCGQNYDKLANG